jgi:multiple sugar transport system permease protein
MAVTSADGGAASGRSWWKENQQWLTPWLFLAPGMLMFAIYVIIPIFESFWLSLYDWDGLGAKTWLGMGNYAELMDDADFYTSLKNNVIWLVLYLLAVPFGLFIAIFLNQTVRGIRIYKSLFFFPFVISQVVVGLVFSWFYAPGFGLFYKVLEWFRADGAWLIAGPLFVIKLIPLALVAVLSFKLAVWGHRRAKDEVSSTLAHLPAALLLVFLWVMAGPVSQFYQTAWTDLIASVSGPGIAILADDRFVTYGIIAAGLWPQTAYCMILYLTGLNNVSPDQVEAARLDGAKGWKMLWYVILPQLRPATFIAVVVTVIGALRSFDLVSIMTDGGPYGSSRVLSFYMYEQALSEYGYRMGYGAAIAVILFLIMMVFISGFIWKMVRDEKEGY